MGLAQRGLGLEGEETVLGLEFVGLVGLGKMGQLELEGQELLLVGGLEAGEFLA